MPCAYVEPKGDQHLFVDQCSIADPVSAVIVPEIPLAFRPWVLSWHIILSQWLRLSNNDNEMWVSLSCFLSIMEHDKTWPLNPFPIFKGSLFGLYLDFAVNFVPAICDWTCRSSLEVISNELVYCTWVLRTPVTAHNEWVISRAFNRWLWLTGRGGSADWLWRIVTRSAFLRELSTRLSSAFTCKSRQVNEYVWQYSIILKKTNIHLFMHNYCRLNLTSGAMNVAV